MKRGKVDKLVRQRDGLDNLRIPNRKRSSCRLTDDTANQVCWQESSDQGIGTEGEIAGAWGSSSPIAPLDSGARCSKLISAGASVDRGCWELKMLPDQEIPGCKALVESGFR